MSMRLTMEELERLAEGQGHSLRTSRDYDGPETSRDVVWYQPTIAALIMDALERAGQPMTRLEIARALNKKKTPWLRDAIERLVEAGEVTRFEGRMPWGAPVWLYEVRR
jgi:hypothetical protein